MGEPSKQPRPNDRMMGMSRFGGFGGMSSSLSKFWVRKPTGRTCVFTAAASHRPGILRQRLAGARPQDHPPKRQRLAGAGHLGFIKREGKRRLGGIFFKASLKDLGHFLGAYHSAIHYRKEEGRTQGHFPLKASLKFYYFAGHAITATRQSRHPCQCRSNSKSH